MTAKGQERSLVLGLAANFILIGAKLAAGILGASQAMLADALNSVLDVVAGAVAWVGWRISKRPPDANHHYGHQNAETVAALFVGLAIFATGGLIVRDVLSGISSGERAAPAAWTIIIAAAVIVTKTVLYIYTRSVARRTPSLVVSATATDHLMDVAATSGALFGLIGAQFGFPILDPIAAIWVALLILIHGVMILRKNTFVLLGGAPSDRTIAEICRTLSGVPGVMGLHRTKVRTVGSQLLVDTEILVDGALTVDEAHTISNRAGDAVLAAHRDVTDVVVHIEPHSARRAAEGANPLTPRQHDLWRRREENPTV
ncbi:MAG: cation diffusion facilitator family transporter [Candidatus Zixiibacteriota bacterium]